MDQKGRLPSPSWLIFAQTSALTVEVGGGGVKGCRWGGIIYAWLVVKNASTLNSYHPKSRKESASVISAKDFERMFRQSQWVPSFEKEKKTLI